MGDSLRWLYLTLLRHLQGSRWEWNDGHIRHPPPRGLAELRVTLARCCSFSAPNTLPPVRLHPWASIRFVFLPTISVQHPLGLGGQLDN